MKLQETYILLLGALFLSDTVLGQSVFLNKHKEAIQNYIKTGHEKGWKQCDILSADTSSHEGAPHVSMDLNKIKNLNVKFSFASSHCLLVTYKVNSKEDLSTLLEFGWTAIQHTRLALVLEMGSGITLDMTKNSTKLPFLIAADLDHGKEQFLCPVLGQHEPRLEQEMCRPSYVSYKDKVLQIGIFGINPKLVVTKNGIDGTDVRFIQLLSKALSFRTELIPFGSFDACVNSVCKPFLGVKNTF